MQAPISSPPLLPPAMAGLVQHRARQQVAGRHFRICGREGTVVASSCQVHLAALLAL
jgi:hypothetical protein